MASKRQSDSAAAGRKPAQSKAKLASTVGGTGKRKSAKRSGTRRTCILVLGMHRSGTSALTRVLSLMGASLPRRMIGAAEGNSAGHWEPARLVEYHDTLLAELGTVWHDWQKLDLTRISSARRAEIRADIRQIIDEDFGDAALMVIKDPRICLFPALFLQVLREANIDVVPVLPVRNPLEVMASLSARSGIWPAHYTANDAALLWLRHVLEAEFATRDYRRAVVMHDALLDDWRALLERLIKHSGLEFPAAIDEAAPLIDEFLQPALRHHTIAAKEVAKDTQLRGWVSDTFKALLQLSANPDAKTAQSVIDRVRQELTHAEPILAALPNDKAEAKHNVMRLAQKSFEHQRRADAAKKQIASLTEQLALSELEHPALADVVADNNTLRANARRIEDILHSFETNTKQQAEKIDTLQAELEVQSSGLALERIRASGLAHQIHATKRSVAWKVASPLRLLSKIFATIRDCSMAAGTRTKTQMWARCL